MAESPRIRRRWLLWALPVWALMLLIGTWTHQPDPQTQFAAFADYITTNNVQALTIHD
jgi:cytochrome c-type biogenesis protein CcmH/NrfF